MSVGAAPTALPPDRPPASLDYLSGFTDMWKQLRKFPASRERCVRSMARFLRKERWAESRGHAEAVTVLAEQLRRDDSNNELVGVVASALQASREAAQWDFARGWVDQVRGNDPGAIRSGLLSALAAVEPGADPVQVATLLRDAQREGISSDQACYVLARVKAIDSPRAAVDVAGALRWEFERSGIDKKETEDWLLGFIQLVARGGFGPEVAAGLTGSLSQAARQEIELQLEILYALAERPGQGELELTDGERAQLEEMRDTIDLLIRKSAKHYLSGLVRKVMRE
jgi:hypothetical protein